MRLLSTLCLTQTKEEPHTRRREAALPAGPAGPTGVVRRRAVVGREATHGPLLLSSFVNGIGPVDTLCAVDEIAR